jgi:hypothetical protein
MSVKETKNILAVVVTVVFQGSKEGDSKWTGKEELISRARICTALEGTPSFFFPLAFSAK